MKVAVRRYLLRGSKAGRKWQSLVKFTSEELRDHLENRFTPLMTWENYGAYWHVDHIKPLAAFAFVRAEDEGFRECWALSNLQPLSAKDNLRKSSNYEGKDYKRKK